MRQSEYDGHLRRIRRMKMTGGAGLAMEVAGGVLAMVLHPGWAVLAVIGLLLWFVAIVIGLTGLADLASGDTR